MQPLVNELDIQEEVAMKRLVLTVAAFAVLASGTFVLAQRKMEDMKSMDTGKKAATGAQTTHQAKATVKKVDPTTGVVTLAHEPIKSLDWPSMTMGFKVKDTSLFDKLVVGNQVQVEIVKEGTDYVVTAVE
jgi:Cu(I)/Ag(I) efflux system protein CusF